MVAMNAIAQEILAETPSYKPRLARKNTSCMEQIKVCGIPCFMKVLHYHGDVAPSYYDEGEQSEFDFELYDRHGYRAYWLEDKLTKEICEEILENYLAG